MKTYNRQTETKKYNGYRQQTDNNEFQSRIIVIDSRYKGVIYSYGIDKWVDFFKLKHIASASELLIDSMTVITEYKVAKNYRP